MEEFINDILYQPFQGYKARATYKGKVAVGGRSVREIPAPSGFKEIFSDDDSILILLNNQPLASVVFFYHEGEDFECTVETFEDDEALYEFLKPLSKEIGFMIPTDTIDEFLAEYFNTTFVATNSYVKNDFFSDVPLELLIPPSSFIELKAFNALAKKAGAEVRIFSQTDEEYNAVLYFEKNTASNKNSCFIDTFDNYEQAKSYISSLSQHLKLGVGPEEDETFGAGNSILGVS